MTLENITTERMRNIEKMFQRAITRVQIIREMAGKGDITIKDAAARINRIGAEIEKAIYPEDQEA